MREYDILENLQKYLIENTNFDDDTRKYYMASCTVDKQGRIIAFGMNSTKTHPLMVTYSKLSKDTRPNRIYLHAEVSALVKSYRKPYAIFVTRINRQKEMAMSKPCPICTFAIQTAGIKRVYYTNREGELVLMKGADIDYDQRLQPSDSS